jgi:hypothetical protein
MKNWLVLILSIIVLGGCASRSNYVGTTQDGKMQGSGVYTYYGVQYSGIWEEGKPEKILTIQWGQGCQYIGEVIEMRPIIQTYEHLVFRPHGQGTWWNTSPSCGWTEQWTYEGEFKYLSPSGQGKLILHTSGTVIEGKIGVDYARGFLYKGTVTSLDGKTTEESNLIPIRYVKDGFSEFLDELELTDVLLFPVKVAVGTVLVAGEIANSPAGQAARANREAKNQKAREEAAYKKGKRDGQRKRVPK